jgi:hypothetical protein
MSLKAFHLVFVSLSTLLGFGLSVWSFLNFRAHGQRTDLLLGVGWFAAAVLLLVYARAFLRKLRKIGLL